MEWGRGEDTDGAGGLRLGGKSSTRENKGHRRENFPLSPGRSEIQAGRMGKHGQHCPEALAFWRSLLALAGHGRDRSWVMRAKM